MAHIRYVPSEEGDELLRSLYAKFHDRDLGGVDNILRISSGNPKAWETHYAFYAHVMRGPSPLTRAQREMIAVVVSAANRCHY
jgi:alkylhydroperoxidase family enzyme